MNLSKKIGPLPTYAWVGLGVLFIGMVWYFRRGSGEEVAVSTDGQQLAGSLPSDDSGVGFTGGGSLPYSETYTALPPATSNLDTGFDWDKFMAQLATYTPQPVLIQVPSGAASPTPIYETPQQPVTTQPVSPSPIAVQEPVHTTTAPVSTKQTSFEWGGETWTKAREGEFRRWLNAHGVSYRTWASNHPKAAMDVFGSMT